MASVNRARPPPRALAAYIAASASRSSATALVAGSSLTAIPTLAATTCSSPATSIGRASSASRRSASAQAASSPSARSLRATNSSPPKRATVSRDPGRRLQAPADLHEQRVARGVPEGVVDELEAVDVEEADRGAGAARERLAQTVEQEAAVRQAGQRVVDGLVLEQRGRAALARDVLQLADEVRGGGRRRRAGGSS